MWRPFGRLGPQGGNKWASREGDLGGRARVGTARALIGHRALPGLVLPAENRLEIARPGPRTRAARSTNSGSPRAGPLSEALRLLPAELTGRSASSSSSTSSRQAAQIRHRTPAPRPAQHSEPPRRVRRLQSLRRYGRTPRAVPAGVGGSGGAAGRGVPPGSRLGVGGGAVGRREAGHRHDRDGARWVRRAEVDAGARPGLSSEESAELRRLKAEVKERRRANEILKAAAGFFAAELDRPHRIS